MLFQKRFSVQGFGQGEMGLNDLFVLVSCIQLACHLSGWDNHRMLLYVCLYSMCFVCTVHLRTQYNIKYPALKMCIQGSPGGSSRLPGPHRDIPALERAGPEAHGEAAGGGEAESGDGDWVKLHQHSKQKIYPPGRASPV